jgi:hypothetical protein
LPDAEENGFPAESADVPHGNDHTEKQIGCHKRHNNTETADAIPDRKQPKDRNAAKESRSKYAVGNAFVT